MSKFRVKGKKYQNEADWEQFSIESIFLFGFFFLEK